MPGPSDYNLQQNYKKFEQLNQNKFKEGFLQMQTINKNNNNINNIYNTIKSENLNFN